MTFDFASEVAQARRVVHDTLGVAATYQDDSMDAPEDIKVRWHNKITTHGDLLETGYAQLIEGIDRIILVPEDTPDITFKRTGIVTITAWGTPGFAFTLDTQEPATGPLEQVWKVSVVE